MTAHTLTQLIKMHGVHLILNQILKYLLTVNIGVTVKVNAQNQVRNNDFKYITGISPCYIFNPLRF